MHCLLESCRLIAYRQWLLAFRIAGTLQPAATTMSMKLLPSAAAASKSLLQPASGLTVGIAAPTLGAAGMGPGGAFDLAVSAQDQVWAGQRWREYCTSDFSLKPLSCSHVERLPSKSLTMTDISIYFVHAQI